MLKKNMALIKRNFLFSFSATVFILLTVVGCANYHSGSSSNYFKSARYTTMYTYGDAAYDAKLQEGIKPVKFGQIPADKVPGEFPRKFLEADGSYGGGRVFPSIEEAEFSIAKAKGEGMLPVGDSGIYELEGDWDSYTYEAAPNDFRLRRSTNVIRRVN